MDSKRAFRVGEFDVEPLAGRISGPQGTEHVQPKVMDVLVCLARHGGMLVERNTILDEVWGRPTSEEVLTRCISELRRALGDIRGEPRYIQTVPKRGYRLIEPVTLPGAVQTTDIQSGVASYGSRIDKARQETNRSLLDSLAGLVTEGQTKKPFVALVVDDHGLFRDGLVLQLKELDGSAVCLEAASCEEALELQCDMLERAGRCHGGRGGWIDLILLDYGLPGMCGLEAIERIKEAFTTPVVIVSAIDDARTIRSAVAHGANGYIPKTMIKSQMFAALGIVRQGLVYLPPQVIFERERPGAEPLTSRQRTVLSRTVNGSDRAMIARELGMSAPEVDAVLQEAFRVLGATNRVEAVYELARRGTPLD